MGEKLLARHLAFVDGIFQGLTQTAAYCQAFRVNMANPKSVKAARSNAARLMATECVAVEVERRRMALDRKVEGTADRIIAELERIAFADPVGSGMRIIDGQVVVSETAAIPDHLRRAIAEVSQTEHGVKIKFHSKEAALRMLAQWRKLLVERVEHDVTDGLAEKLAAARERAKGTTP